MEGRELRRSYTQVEFPVTRNRQHHQFQHGRNPNVKKYQMPTSKIKTPAMELYKPPNQRETTQTGGTILATPKLNVHAKEFNPIKSSRSTGTMNEVEAKKHNQLNSKSQMTRTIKNDLEGPLIKTLQKSKSTSSTLLSITTLAQIEHFDNHAEKILLMKALTATKTMPWVDLIDTIPKIIIGRALRDRAHTQSFASLSLILIERDTTGTFLESLLNNCRFTLQTKCMVDNTSRYHAFMAYLNELYSLVKQKQIQHKPGLSVETPVHTVLYLIVQVCQSILQQKTMQLAEIECLFFTVTTIGRDLEAEDGKLLDGLMNYVRDAFLSSNTTEAMRQNLLQLIELRASKWSLPINAFIFYAKHLS